LKSGKKVTGKIIERTDEYIKIEAYGVPLTFYLDEIQKLEDKNQPLTPVKKPALAQETVATKQAIQPDESSDIPIIEDNLYINELLGFKILTPKWIERGFNPRQIEFDKDRELTKGAFTTKFMISIDKSSNFPQVNSAFDYAQGVLKDVTAKFRDKLQIIDPPKIVKIRENDAATLTYKILGNDLLGNKGLIVVNYFYYLGDNVVVLMFADGDKTFERYMIFMNKYLRSFEKLDPEDNLSNLIQLKDRPVRFNPPDQSYNELKNDVLKAMDTKHTYRCHLTIKDMLNENLAQFDHRGADFNMTFVDNKNFEVQQLNYYTRGTEDIWRVFGEDIFIKIGLWMPMPTELSGQAKDKQKAAMEQMIKNRRNVYQELSFGRYLQLLKNDAPSEMSKELTTFTILKFSPSRLDFIPFKTWQITEPQITISKSNVLLWISNRDKTIRIAKITIEGKDKEGKTVIKEFEHYFTNFNLAYTLGEPPNIYQKNE
jgi:hypothetical protein